MTVEQVSRAAIVKQIEAPSQCELTSHFPANYTLPKNEFRASSFY